MNGRDLALASLAGLAAAGIASRRAGSRAALAPTENVGVVRIGTNPEPAWPPYPRWNLDAANPPVLILLDLAQTKALRRLPRDPEQWGKNIWRSEGLGASVPELGCILGFAAFEFLECGQSGPQPLAVSRSVAQSGWGPLLYDVALAFARDAAAQDSRLNGFLCPDRESVSDEATAVWRYYKGKRRDEVLVRKLPPDCRAHGVWPNGERMRSGHPVLDAMYQMKSTSPVLAAMPGLFARGDAAVRDLASRFRSGGGTGIPMVHAALQVGGAELFNWGPEAVERSLRVVPGT